MLNPAIALAFATLELWLSNLTTAPLGGNYADRRD